MKISKKRLFKKYIFPQASFPVERDMWPKNTTVTIDNENDGIAEGGPLHGKGENEKE